MNRERIQIKDEIRIVKDKKKENKRAEEEEKALKAEAESKKAAEAEIDALNERLLRLQADFENFRKRTLREKNELYRRANQDIIQEFLPVLDHLDLAIEAANTDNKGKDDVFFEGVRLVSEQMLTVLKKFGVVPVDADGQQFDSNRHEAISHIASEEFHENMVITQVRRGYMLGDKLLRAAQVVVSSGARSTQGSSAGAAEDAS